MKSTEGLKYKEHSAGDRQRIKNDKHTERERERKRERERERKGERDSERERGSFFS